MARPVLLVPGAVGQDYVYWNLFTRRLRRDGFEPHTVVFPRFTMLDLRVSAEHLARRVDEVREGTGAAKVPLVAHSMGGLIARWYLRFLGGAGNVSAIAHMGVPHRGTVAGFTGLPFRGARQVVPGSPFLNELNAADAVSVPTMNVYSLTDLIVIPQLSARLDQDGAVNRQVTLAGHWGMLVSKDVYRHVREGLGGAPADESSAGEREPAHP